MEEPKNDKKVDNKRDEDDQKGLEKGENKDRHLLHPTCCHVKMRSITFAHDLLTHCHAMSHETSREVTSILGTEDGEAAVEEKNEDILQTATEICEILL